MNFIDQIILSISPGWAATRFKNRILAENLKAYDAAKPGRTRKMKIDNRSGDASVVGAAASIRGQSRYLDENHDLVIGILDVLEQKVVGPKGISIEPMPYTVAGEKHEEFAKEISLYFDELSVAPETTGEHSRAVMEQLVCRSWLRDGDVFGKYIEGTVPNFKHNTRIPFSIELLESDFLPFELRDKNDRITQGVERNAWGQPLAYHFLKSHPGDAVGYSSQTVRVPSDKVQHLKYVKRIRQARGISILHGVITRLEDLKDYEESERVAARISAVLAAYLKRAPDSPAPKDLDGNNTFQFAPGMFFDGLLPGEEIGTVQSNRPSALLQPFRDSMLRAVASGTRSTFSTISGQYDGSYSAQRQEMVEGYAGYGVLQEIFISKWSSPFYRRAVQVGIASGLLKLPPDIDERTLFNAVYLPPVMPWIDPEKESKSHERKVKAGFDTEASVIRSLGKNPQEVKKQRQREIEENAKRNLVFSSDARHELQKDNTHPGETNDAE